MIAGDAEGARVTSRFGALLREWRLRAGLSQDALAHRAQVGERTVRGLETGERTDPRIGTVRALADALGLSGDERAELFAAAGQGEPPDRPTTADLPADPLAEAADALANAVLARWRREEEQRQVHDPVPLPVRWTAAPDELRDSWANIGGPLDVDGQLDRIVETYQRIPSGRLVVLGRAGAGKTILTTRFVLDLLARRKNTDPVPVVVSVGSWHPTRTGLRDWLAEQLVRDHPGLAAPAPGAPTLAAALVDANRVLPVLDGFDEIATGLHRAALAALNASTLPLVLTSRVDEYREAVAATDVLTSAAAVVLSDLTADDLAGYLPRTTRKAPGWQPVLDDVRADPDGALAAVLTTPLMVALARRVYSDTPDHDPAELLAFDDRDALERHLLAGFVPAAYQGRDAADVTDVLRWLGHLADHLTRLDTHDLAWWQLGTSAGRPTRSLAVAVLAGLGVGLVDLLVEGVLIGGITVGLVVFSALIGVVGGVLFGVMHGVAVGTQPLEPVRVQLRLRGPRWRRPRVVARFRLGLLVGVWVGAGYALARGLAFWLVGGGWSVAVLVDTAIFAGVFGLGAALVFGLVAAIEAPLDLRSAGSPAGLLATDRRAVRTQVLVVVPVFALFVDGVTWLVAMALADLTTALDIGLGVRWDPVLGLAIGLIGGLGGGLGYVLSFTAWGQWLVFARVWLPLTGRLPWAVHRFLDDAYLRGVLRRTGAVYQFRHARLREHLTESYRDRA